MTDTPPADIGLIGLAVMGQNLALNMADHGYRVAVHNRTTGVVDDFLAGEAAATTISGHHSVPELVAALARPRKVMLMIKAGDPVDLVIDQVAPLLDAGDVIIDGGNSRYTDTQRREAALQASGIHYVGTGISGGELGARHGPSLMPGGSAAAWPLIAGLFQDIAATAEDGAPCADWLGPGGAGHYVKMVHNGIEYADMQLIAEAYDLLHRGVGLDHDQLAEVFAAWDQGELDSYLIEITAGIMTYRDQDGEPLLPKILDAAGQKGTGKWTVISSMEMGAPSALIAEAVYARILSSLQEERGRAAGVLPGPEPRLDGSRDEWVGAVRQALYASKIVAYAQGFMLLGQASTEHRWGLDFGTIATIWSNGTIIRSRFLGDIRAAYRRDPALPNLLLDSHFAGEVAAVQGGWRRVVAEAAAAGIPVPAYGSALAFYDGYRSSTLPANLIQAQRDFFGAHTYERVDQPRGEFFHTDWTGTGGDTTAGSYSA